LICTKNKKEKRFTSLSESHWIYLHDGWLLSTRVRVTTALRFLFNRVGATPEMEFRALSSLFDGALSSLITCKKQTKYQKGIKGKDWRSSGPKASWRWHRCCWLLFFNWNGWGVVLVFPEKKSVEEVRWAGGDLVIRWRKWKGKVKCYSFRWCGGGYWKNWKWGRKAFLGIFSI